MNEAAIRQRLAELTDAIVDLPGGKSPGAEEGICASCSSSKDRTLDNSIDLLRLQVKYLLFDLEATRRENRYLRQMLEQRRRPDSF